MKENLLSLRPLIVHFGDFNESRAVGKKSSSSLKCQRGVACVCVKMR